MFGTENNDANSNGIFEAGDTLAWGIMTNAGSIMTNSGRITANEGNISSSADAIANNMNSIGQNQAAIGRNSETITGLQDQMEIVQAGGPEMGRRFFLGTLFGDGSQAPGW